MGNVMNKVEEKMMPIASRLASNMILTAIRNTMISLMPFFIVGSIFLLFAYLPIEGYDEFINGIFGEGVLQGLVTAVSNATINVMGLIILIGVSYNYSRAKEEDPIFIVITNLMVFLIVTPLVDGNIASEWLGAKGMFISILIAIIFTNIFIKIKKLGIQPKMPDTVPPAVTKSFGALVPIALVSVIAVLIRALFMNTSYGDIHHFVFAIVQAPLLKLGNNIFSMIIAEMLGQFLWFFGLHGNDIVGSVMSPVWLSQSAENLAAFTANTELPFIITKQFKDIFMQMGGSGSTLPLVISLIFLTKSKQLRTLGILALPASLFNINEPIIFGLPIVLNAIMFIPWMLATPIVSIITYVSMSIGLVSLTSGVIIPWTTPVVLSGYLVSGVSGAILQIVLLVVVFFIYYPFIKILDKRYHKEEMLDLSIAKGV